MDVNMSVSLTEPDFKDRVVLHCLERARSTVQERSTNWSAISHRLHQEFIPKRHTPSSLLAEGLSQCTTVAPLLSFYLLSLQSKKRWKDMNVPWQQSSASKIKCGAKPRLKIGICGTLLGSQISHFYADNIRWSGTELRGKLNTKWWAKSAVKDGLPSGFSHRQNTPLTYNEKVWNTAGWYGL